MDPNAHVKGVKLKLLLPTEAIPLLDPLLPSSVADAKRLHDHGLFIKRIDEDFSCTSTSHDGKTGRGDDAKPISNEKDDDEANGKR